MNDDGLLTEQQNTYVFLVFFSSDSFGPFLMFPPDSVVCSIDFFCQKLLGSKFLCLFSVVLIKIFNLEISSLLIYFLASVLETLNEQMHVDTVFKILILTLKDVWFKESC